MRLLEDYKGKKVTAKTATGFITFDTDNTDESEYEMFYNLGFDFCFEPSEPTYKKPRRYIGIEQESASTKLYKNKDGKKGKAKTKEA